MLLPLNFPQKNTDFSNGGRVSRNKSRVTEESEQSQSDHITYDDPAGRMEREKIMAHLKKTSPSRYLDPDGDEEHDEEGHDRAVVGGGDDTTMVGERGSCGEWGWVLRRATIEQDRLITRLLWGVETTLQRYENGAVVGRGDGL